MSATLCDWRTMLPARSKMQSRFSAKQEERGKVPSGRAAIRSLSPVSGQSQIIARLPAVTRWATRQALTPMVDFDQGLIALFAAI